MTKFMTRLFGSSSATEQVRTKTPRGEEQEIIFSLSVILALETMEALRTAAFVISKHNLYHRYRIHFRDMFGSHLSPIV